MFIGETGQVIFIGTKSEHFRPSEVIMLQESYSANGSFPKMFKFVDEKIVFIF